MAQFDRRPKTAERGYGGKWQRARVAFLMAHPLCVFCEARGIVSVATVVDHIVPHRGDMALFWDRGNWQPLCKLCHDSVKQSREKSGQVHGCGLDGMPVDAGHHWRR